jgi:nicotinate-nucleotide adenylyltransferase
MARRRAILGGSFDPIHAGHVAVVRAALERPGVERVYVVPAARPPHKREGCRAPFADRVAMARLALRGLDRVEVLELEGERPGPSYTIDTVEELRRRHPGEELELLVGADMLADLPSWRRAAELARSVTVVAFARPGFDLDAAKRAFRAAFPGARLEVMALPETDASSTEARSRVGGGEPAPRLLHPDVEAYIRTRGLYRREGD